MKKCKELFLHLRDNFSANELAENRELSMLLVFSQNNKDVLISDMPDVLTHLYKKHLNLYSIEEMIKILQTNGKLDSISAKLLDDLRTEQADGRTTFNIHPKGRKALINKYL